MDDLRDLVADLAQNEIELSLWIEQIERLKQMPAEEIMALFILQNLK